MKEKRSNSTIVKDFDQQLVLDALAPFNDGEVAIVWDRLLVRQLGMLVSPRVLSEKYNVMQNLSLDKTVVVGAKISHIVYFVASLTSSVDKLIQNFPEHQTQSLKGIHVFFIPEANYVLIERLKASEFVWRQIGRAVSSIPCHWFPNDQPNFLHMSLPQLPQRMIVDGDWNFLYKCAIALYQLKKHLINSSGRNISIYCKGEWSTRVVEMLKRLEKREDEDDAVLVQNNLEGEISASSSLLLDIDKIVIMDRWLDILTPMLTQFTFAGAIDELFGIDVQGKMGTLPADETSKEGEQSNKEMSNSKNVGLILKGEVHEQLQDLHLNAVAVQIKQILKELFEEEQMLKSLSTISDLKNCVGRIQEILGKRKWTENFLKIAEIVQRKYSEDFFVEVVTCQQNILAHAQNTNGGGGEKVNSFIENAIIEARSPSTVLRLIAIQSLAASKGLRSQVAQAYRKLFLQSYGIFSLRWWLKLQLAGFIREEASFSQNAADRRFKIRCSFTNYAQCIKRYRLYYPEVDEVKCSDSAYAYNGRTSLLIRYLEDGFTNDWSDFIKIENFFSDGLQDNDFSSNENVVNKLPIDSIASSFSSSLGLSIKKQKVLEENKVLPRTMLFVVGGLTRAEISAVRQLHSDKVCLCASTAVITSDSFLSSFN